MIWASWVAIHLSNLFLLDYRELISSKEVELRTLTRTTLEALISIFIFSSSCSDSSAEEPTPLSLLLFWEDSSLPELTDHQFQSPSVLNFLRDKTKLSSLFALWLMTLDSLKCQRWLLLPSDSPKLLEPRSLRPVANASPLINSLWPLQLEPILSSWELPRIERPRSISVLPQVFLVLTPSHTSDLPLETSTERDMVSDRATRKFLNLEEKVASVIHYAKDRFCWARCSWFSHQAIRQICL